MTKASFNHLRAAMLASLLIIPLSAPRSRSESAFYPEATDANPGAIVRELTLEDLMEQTLKRSEWMLFFSARVEEKQFAAEQSRRFQNPEASISTGEKRISSVRGSTTELLLNQPFLFPGKRRLKSEIADSGTELAKINKSKAEVSLIYNVLRIAFQHAINRQKSEFARKRQDRFELIKSYLSGRTFATQQKRAERHVVESRLRKLRTEGIEIETALKASLEKLRLYVLLDEKDPKIQVPWLMGTAALDEGLWESKVVNHNPDLAAQRLLVNQAGFERLLAQKERWSDFSLHAFYGIETPEEVQRTFGAGITLSLPLLNLNTGSIRSFEKQYEAERHLFDFQERELKTRLRQAMIEYDAAREIASLYPQSLFAGLQDQNKKDEDAFSKGQLDLLLFLETDEQTAETTYRAFDAQLTLVDKLANLFLMAGERDLHAQLKKF